MSEYIDREIGLKTIRVVTARPERADVRKIRELAAAAGRAPKEFSYVIKLYIDTAPRYDNLGLELYVGDHKVRKYMQFVGGIYFKVHDPEQLSALRGQRVRFHRPGSEEFFDTGVEFPIEDIATSALEVGESMELPTLEEALRE